MHLQHCTLLPRISPFNCSPYIYGHTINQHPWEYGESLRGWMRIESSVMCYELHKIRIQPKYNPNGSQTEENEPQKIQGSCFGIVLILVFVEQNLHRESFFTKLWQKFSLWIRPSVTINGKSCECDNSFLTKGK